MKTTSKLSKARAAALKHLHASRRGKRIHADVPRRERETTLAAVATHIRKREPGRRSLRAAAAFLHVDPRTLGRWLSGEHWPSFTDVTAMRKWVQRVRS